MFDWDDIDEFFDDDFADSAIYNDIDISVIPYMRNSTYKGEDAGEQQEVDLRLMIKVVDFETSPKKGEKIEYQNIVYRILNVETDSNSKVYILGLGAEFAV